MTGKTARGAEAMYLKASSWVKYITQLAQVVTIIFSTGSILSGTKRLYQASCPLVRPFPGISRMRFLGDGVR
jgi:hypothetical protein